MDALINNNEKREDYKKIKRDSDVFSAGLHFMMNYNESEMKRLAAHTRNMIDGVHVDFVVVDQLHDEDVINDDAFKDISLENLKKSAIASSKREFYPILQGYKFSDTFNYFEFKNKGRYFLILTGDAFFLFIEDKIAAIPVHDLWSVMETRCGLIINARRVSWFDRTGNSIDGENFVSIRRNKETEVYIRPLRKAVTAFIGDLKGYTHRTDDEVERVVGEYIGKISKSSALYLTRDLNYDDDAKRKKMKTALSTYALKVYERDVIGFIDISLFNNGRDGLLFAKDGIAFDYAFEKVFLHYDEIERMSYDKKGNHLNFHGHFVERKDNRNIPSISDIYFNLNMLQECIQEIQYVI